MYATVRASACSFVRLCACCRPGRRSPTPPAGVHAIQAAPVPAAILAPAAGSPAGYEIPDVRPMRSEATPGGPRRGPSAAAAAALLGAPAVTRDDGPAVALLDLDIPAPAPSGGGKCISSFGPYGFYILLSTSILLPEGWGMMYSTNPIVAFDEIVFTSSGIRFFFFQSM